MITTIYSENIIITAIIILVMITMIMTRMITMIITMMIMIIMMIIIIIQYSSGISPTGLDDSSTGRDELSF